MKQENLTGTLFSLQDAEYQKMQQRLLPNIDPRTIIGVRTPELRRIAKEIEDPEAFLLKLPHSCFEENQIHSFILERGKDFSDTIAKVEKFLPYIDNWATCDQLRPNVFRKHHQELLPYISCWIISEHPYTVRYAIGMLMVHYLDKDFHPSYLEMVASVQSDEYYVKMMVAWYFATALAKQFEAAVPYISEYRLEKWTHNKAIQKSVESYRITAEQKAFLKQYRMK